MPVNKKQRKKKQGPRESLRTPFRSHLKYAKLQPYTLHRYRVAVDRFFSYLLEFILPMPTSMDMLDELASEFINHLYQDDYPLGWANDFLCGIKRLYPKCRRKLDISSHYFSLWTKTVSRTRAIPLTEDLVKGMAAVSLMRGSPRFAACLLLGFVGLLRTGELLSLIKQQLFFFIPVTLWLSTCRTAKDRKDMDGPSVS